MGKPYKILLLIQFPVCFIVFHVFKMTNLSSSDSWISLLLSQEIRQVRIIRYYHDLPEQIRGCEVSIVLLQCTLQNV